MAQRCVRTPFVFTRMYILMIYAICHVHEADIWYIFSNTKTYLWKCDSGRRSVNVEWGGGIQNWEHGEEGLERYSGIGTLLPCLIT